MKYTISGRFSRGRRGAALIASIAFTGIIATLLTGIGMLTVSHLRRARIEADYAAAISLAEAGASYELNKISQKTAWADQANAPYVGTLGNGAFSVYCVDRDTGGVWSPPNKMYVVATGTVNGYSRTVRIAAKGFGSSALADYSLYGVSEGIINGSATYVNGSVGTNGFLLFNGHPTVTGGVYFNGPGSDWQGPDPSGYNVTYSPQPINWPSVETIASRQFPQGGLPWIATHNDNSLSSPRITGPTVLINGSGTMTFRSKVGGAHYYLTNLILNGNSKIYFDNSLGPITIWVGPSGASNTFVINGGNSLVPVTSDPAKAVRIYFATTSDIPINGNNRLEAGLYNVNNAKKGRIINNGNPTIYGTIISNKFTFNGNITFGYTAKYFEPDGTGPNYYGFDNEWVEITGGQ